MGKQGRRKQRQKRKQDKQNIPQNETSPVNPSSAIHQLRHANPQIRHAALIALQATFLHPSQKRISLTVLQAVREQILDSNMECASAAAECLAQYMSFANPSSTEEHASATASWTLILISRLEQCHQAIHTKSGSLKQWYALAAPCLRTLCKLIETNESALEQMNTKADSFLSVLTGLLQDVTTFEKTSDDRLTEWVQETATYTARTLHSSLDENPDMVERVNSVCADPTVWAQLLAGLPDLAQLHLCGSLVTLYQMAPTAWQAGVLTEQVLPRLLKSSSVDGQNLQHLETTYSKAIALWKTQEADNALEQDIIRKVQQRKEPARLIARRQKDLERGSKAIMEDTEDGQQAMETAWSAWNSVMLPLQVALEVTANMLGCFVQMENAMEEDDRDHLTAMDKSILQSLVSTKVAERLLQSLQSLCQYQGARQAEQNEELSDDLQECISKCAACLTNSVLSQVLTEADFATTWQVLRPHAATAKGVSSVMVVLAQHGSTLPTDTELIQQLLHTQSDEDLQRDGIGLLAAALRGPNVEASTVSQATQELLTLLKQGSASVRVEVLNVMMDLYGEDEFFPQVFTSLNVLASFQSGLGSLSASKNLDPEAEEIVFNASRFVDYKLGR